MKGAKYILTAAVIAMSSVMMTGCFKPSKMLSWNQNIIRVLKMKEINCLFS